MKRQKGFSLVELMVSSAIVLLIVGATLGTFNTALNATQAITLLADTQENLRAGMNYMVRDFIQTGEGVPQGGITIPNTSGASAVNRPGPGTPSTSFGTFNTGWTALPALVPGYQQGPVTSTSGVGTDMVTMMYADTTLQDTNGHWLNEFPIRYPATGTASTPHCASSNATPQPQGTIVTGGTTTTVTFDPTCIVINNGNTGLNAGDLILMQNNNTIGDGDGSVTGSDAEVSASSGSMALLCISGVNQAANSITFSAGDAFNLNASGAAQGTLANIQTSGQYPVTTATRIWMITYYIDNTNPARPQLMRQVNLNQPQAVGEVIENLQIYYDILNAGSNPVTVTNEVEAPTTAQLVDIRDAYIMMFARSEVTYPRTNQYLRNNLETAVSIRGLDFYNEFK